MVGFLEVAIALMPFSVALDLEPLPSSGQAVAQVVPSEQGNLLRARNLARQAAEQANGGLSRYRAEAAMHGMGTLPVTDQGDRWVFRFVGGAPAAVPTIETVVTVMKSDFAVRVDYNGAIQ